MNRAHAIVCISWFISISITNSLHFGSEGYKGVIIKVNDKVTAEIIEQTQELVSRASFLLYNASNQKAFFGEVVFLFKNDIYELNLTHTENATWEAFANTELALSSFSTKIEARRGPFCGDVGYRLILPTSVTGDEIEARNFVQQWVKYRYGVFDETSLELDAGGSRNCFWDNGLWKLTGCYDQNHEPEALRVALQEDGTFECLVQGKIRDLFSNVTLKSSLMFTTAITSVEHFCNDETYPHNSLAPTSHNFYCHGRSVEDVIWSGSDFLNQGPITFAPPKFRYVQIQPARLVIVLQNRIALQHKNVLIKALDFFHKHLMSDNTEVGLVTFSNESTKITEQVQSLGPSSTRDTLSTTVRFAHHNGSEFNYCPLCGIQEALNMLGDENRSNTILLIGDISELLPSIKETFVNKKARVFVMGYVDNDHQLEQHRNMTSWLYHPDDFYPLTDNEHIDEELAYLALMDIVNRLDGYKRMSLVYESLNNPRAHYISGEFSTTGSLSGFLFLQTSCYMIYSTSPTNPLTILFNGDPSERVVQLKPTNVPMRVWNYSVDTSDECLCSVFAFVSEDMPINYRMAESSYHRRKDHSSFVALNVDLGGHNFKDDSNIDVKAKVTSFVDGSQRVLELHDDGKDPDLVEHDDLYSGYLVLGNRSVPGLYSVHSLISTKHLNVTFCKYDYSGSIVIWDSIYFPPGRIKDLSVVRVQRDLKLLTLSWTKPGAYLDKESGVEFDVRYATNWEGLNENNFDQAVKLNESVQDESSISAVYEIPPEDPNVFYVALRTRNLVGEASLVSNHVQLVSQKFIPTTTGVVTTTTLETSSDLHPVTTVPCNCTDSTYAEAPFSKTLIIVIIVSSLCAVILIIIICNLLVCWGVVKDHRLLRLGRLNQSKHVGNVNLPIRRNSIRNSSRNSIQRSIHRDQTTLERDNDLAQSYGPNSPNHLINNNLRNSPSQFIIVSNENAAQEMADTPSRRLSLTRKPTRGSTTQNKLVFDGSRPTEDLRPRSQLKSFFANDAQAINPIYDTSDKYSKLNLRGRPNRSDSFYLGEV